MSTYWEGKRVLVTGAGGFIGSYVVRALLERGARITASCTSLAKASRIADLASRVNVVEANLSDASTADRLCREQQVVISLAHTDGSLVFKRSRPAFLFHQNMLITLNMLAAACRNNVEKFVLTSSSEVYPLNAEVPTGESQPVLGQLDRPTDGYVWSKRMSELATTLFAHEYGMTILVARPSNVYGPGDDFDEARGRVIPAFITKALRNQPIVIWGSGEQVRSFLYVEDLARGMLDLCELGNAGDVLNFSGDDSTIRSLAELIVQLTGSTSEIRCEPDKPAGPLNRVFDSSRAERMLGFKSTVDLKAGLMRTLASYREQSLSASAGRD